MNFLANPVCLEILRSLPKRRYELVCGIDYRRLTPEIASLLKEKGFHKIRWAWDYGFSLQRKHQMILRILVNAGFTPRDLSVFILVNWKIPYIECLRKLDLLKVWNLKANDCCYDGGYPHGEIDFNNNSRFNDKRFWAYDQIKDFRRKCRKHNHLVRFRIDPEYKGV
jgi:hypothetical protein